MEDRDYSKMLLTMFFTMFLSLMASCTHIKYVPVESTRVDSIYINKLQVDSIYMQDSVYIREKGDTIYMYKFKYLDRYKLLTDTMYVNRTDTICNVVEIEKPLTKWQKVKLDMGGFAFGGIVVLAIIAIFALIKRKW